MATAKKAATAAVKTAAKPAAKRVAKPKAVFATSTENAGVTSSAEVQELKNQIEFRDNVIEKLETAFENQERKTHEAEASARRLEALNVEISRERTKALEKAQELAAKLATAERELADTRAAYEANRKDTFSLLAERDEKIQNIERQWAEANARAAEVESRMTAAYASLTQRNQELNEESLRLTESVNRIPRWIRAIFGA